jgi:beta-glucosidase
MGMVLGAPARLFLKLKMKKPKRADRIEYQYCTAIPIGTALAQSWDVGFARRCGEIVGEEMRRFGVRVWLAPAMNIHRDIRCGRNFEYFSEDPLLSGEMAAAITRGVQETPGCAATVKHFAANNQELNRTNNNSLVSERALREIYLRGFEIAVKEGDPITIMSSYNLINGQHTSESWELLTGILRTEWGFRGMVATDWGVKNDPVTEVLAGNDLKMPVGYPADLKKGLEDGRLTRADLEVCVRRILEMTLRMA